MKKFLFGILGLLFAVPAVADTSGAISSVTVAGLVAQNGTPTPNTPVDIVSNNGVLKLSPNLVEFNETRIDSTTWATADKTKGFEVKADVYNKSVGGQLFTNSNCFGVFVPAKINESVSLDFFDYSPDYSRCYYCEVTADGKCNTAPVSFASGGAISQQTFTLTQADSIGFVFEWYISAQQTRNYTKENYMIVRGTSIPTAYMPYGQIYADGTVETIADSANHTATVATLLGVGDYRDTQNINTGAITRNVGVKVLDGTENWTLLGAGTAQDPKRFAVSELIIFPDSNTIECLSTHYPFSGVAPTGGGITPGTFNVGIYNNIHYIRFAPTDITTLEGWTNWLKAQYAAGTPVTVIYPLAEPTTESVAGQTMTTAPVNNRTGGVAGMTITTLLSSGASVVTTIATNAIKIATTAYNSARFSPVVTELNDTIATIRDVVTNTINQTKAIADLQATKQTRPNETCPAGKKCLLVETEENGVIVPHWYEIVESPEVQ